MMKYIQKILENTLIGHHSKWLTATAYAACITCFSSHPAIAQTDSTNTDTIRIAFYYLPTTLEKFDSLEALSTVIDEQVEQANHIYQSSGVNVEFEVATVTPWPTWSDNSSHYTQWPTYSATKIYLEASPYVKTLWDWGELHAYEADALFIVDYRDPSDSHCGWATIDTEVSLRDKSSTSSFGMFRLGHGCGTAASVLAHELGHLLGAAHGYDEQLEATSHMGYGVECGGKSTLMYPTFPKHDFISDPDKTEGGDACGFQDAADNVQLFQQRVPLLAAKVPTLISSTANNTSNAHSSTEADDLEVAANTNSLPTQPANQEYSLNTAGSASGGSSTSMLTLVLTALYSLRNIKR